MNADVNQRQSILDRLRSKPLPAAELPEIQADRLIQFNDPHDRFAQMLELVGGQIQVLTSRNQIAATLNELEEFANAKEIASLVPDAVPGNVDVSEVDDPHDLASLDWVIVPGEFMVAENGAIWIDGSHLPHRVMLFIPQYLAIVVRRDQIVHNMHEAYQRIGRPIQPFGVFVSGPSKTADIEQSLVLGAHGCRNLQVLVTP